MKTSAISYDQAKLTVFEHLLPRIGDILDDTQAHMTVVVTGIHNKGMNGRMVMVRGLRKHEFVLDGAFDLSTYWYSLNTGRLVLRKWKWI